MYERHFGITGPPFQLSPDPAFLFGGSQHQAALTALRQAFSSDLPFVVLSGEIGAGKTTVLRACLAEAATAGIIVAQITNTQLDAEGLLSAITTAFGLDAAASPGDAAPAALRRFLRGLGPGAAAVLSIDEAQNLDRPALHSLVVLAHAAAQEGARLRIFLVGQPELRAHVADAALPELQARIQQSCHLGPLGPQQTRQYIEHRLRKVGWKGLPAFDASAFDEIHKLTGGVPRRINVLANRLMLGQFLNDTAHVDRSAVAAIAQALDAEIGEGSVTHDSPREAPKRPAAAVPAGALLLLASGRSDYVKAMALMCATDRRRDLPPTVIVGLSDGTAWRLNRNLQRYLGCTRRLHALADDSPATDGSVEALFERLVGACRPSAVIVFDGDALTQRCAATAGRLGVALVQIGADAQTVGEGDDSQSPRQAIRQLAALRFDCQSAQLGAGASSRFAPAHSVGNLLADAVQLASKVAKLESRRAGKPIAPGGHVDARRGYGVVHLKQPAADTRAPCAPGVLPLLREVSRDLPLVWPMRHATMLLAHTTGMTRTLEGDRIARIEELGYVNFLRLMAGATCVLTDSADVMEEAAILGVPRISLGPRHVSHVQVGGWMRGYEVGGMTANATRAVWQILFSGPGDTSLPALWDGDAGARIAEHVALWLDRQAALGPQPGPLRPPLHRAAGVGLDRSA